MAEEHTQENLDFIREIVKSGKEAGAYGGRINTRFPPEPNGYLHIGHAKAICLNFGIAREFGGLCNLRFDDTNPEKEKTEYIDAIQDDIRWLGFDWGNRLYYASDYFAKLEQWAIALIKKGKAYVCDLTDDKIKEYRGTAVFGAGGKRETPPGKNSPYRDRSAEENLDLFERMRKGEFADGSRTLRAKIDMAHPNLNMRDPVMYRINRAEHYRQGRKYCIYPMYDWAHGQSDAIEGITHSCCDVGFENHRPLYDWYLEQLQIPEPPHQYEFARLNITYTILSKRYLRELVEECLVHGWDDPRLPTLKGMRRRGYTPESIREFCRRIGISKTDSVVDIQVLEHCVREHLNKTARRVMGVINPVKLVITNYPEDASEELDAVNNPEDASAGTRKIPFSRELYIEREDFMENPPSSFFRLAPGKEVRLRYAYFVTCTGVTKDASGAVTEIQCTYDPATRGGDAPDGRRVKGTLHWVCAKKAVKTQMRLYDYLFTKEDPNDAPDGDWKKNINPSSLTALDNCYVEPCAAEIQSGQSCQFERLGYFCADPDSRPGKPVFNRTVSLKDTWKKIAAKNN